MACQTCKYLLLDTNILLHYQRLDYVNWQEVAEASDVTLLLSQVTLTELEEVRYKHAKRKIRERATTLSKWLSRLLDNPVPIEIKANTYIEFIHTDPQIDIGRHQLSTTNLDDQLIATYLDLAGRGGDNLYVVTNDLPLRAKLRAREIPTIRLNDKYLLPNEPDEVEAELVKVRKELRKLQGAIPSLEILHSNHGHKREYILLGYSTGSIAELVRKKREELPLYDLDKASYYGTGYSAQINILKKNYNDKLGAFFEKYKAYLISKISYPVELTIRNVGRSPATNIDVEITFSDDITLSTILGEVEKPSPPKRPNFRVTWGRAIVRPAVPPPATHKAYNNFVDIINRTAHYHLDEIKHNCSVGLPGFSFYIPDIAVTNFSCSFLITTRENPEVIRGDLHFLFRNNHVMA